MLIPLKETYNLLYENERYIIKSDRDGPNKLNKIVRPQGIVFQDTYNNFIFPIKDVQIDSSKPNITRIFRGFREKYINIPTDMLPWHYLIEMIGNRYVVYHTRPLDTRFPARNSEVLEHKHEFLSDDIKRFFKDKTFRVDDMIHVCIIGDTNLDIYPWKMMRMIGRLCVAPLFKDMRISGSPNTRIFNFNLGKKFYLKDIIAFARK